MERKDRKISREIVKMNYDRYFLETIKVLTRILIIAYSFVSIFLNMMREM